jgi:hypothetical protein
VQVVALWQFHELDRQLGDFPESSAVLQQRLSAESANKTQQRYGGRHAGLQKIVAAIAQRIAALSLP